MKRFLGIPLILLLVSCVQDRVKPYVLQERSQGKVLVKINFRAPSARDVYVAGTFNDWTVPRYKDEAFSHPELRPYRMERHGDIWSVVIPMSLGLQYYKFYVDFIYWRIDETSHEKTQSLNGDWRNIVFVK